MYIAGTTESTTGIATNNGYKTTIMNDDFDAYLVRFNSSGNRQWGTYYGGDDSERGLGVSTDISNNVYLAGMTTSFSQISHNGFQNDIGGSLDAFLTKFKPYNIISDLPIGFGGLNDQDRDLDVSDKSGDFLSNGRYADQADNFNMPEMKIFPNPASEQIYINMGNATDIKSSLDIIDFQGKTVFTEQIEGNIYQSIDVRSWARGVYIIKLKTPFQEYTQKFVVD